ncbi:MAG: efflux RND transporter periplasmic adaptor subunit [bacterium]|nr:efflux RND transporter periplasmic adaptor subunit [bacterium]
MNLHKHTKKIKLAAIIVVVLLFSYLIIHHFTKPKPPNFPTPQVIVQKPQNKEMAEYVTQTGTTVAYNSVNLVARVAGYLNLIEFTDGTRVKKGQELFVIQPEPYMEQLKAAQATVAAQKAAYQYSKAEYDRQKRMYKENATSLNNVEKWLAKMNESQAEVAKAQADEEVAAINYSYTHILAPYNGRMGRHLVDPGNLVGNGEATNLATIDQIDKLYVYFNLNELDLIKLRAAVRARGFTNKDINKIQVDINMQNETGFEHKAKLDFVNTGLNAATGTMELRAILENKDYLFVPGLFVQVRIPVSKPKSMLTVPDTAVLYDQIGPYLLLVDKNHQVVLQRIELGSLEQNIRGVAKGLNAQDWVIVDGLQNATPGNQVAPHEQDNKKSTT